MLLAIDPGSTESAYVLHDGVRLRAFAKLPNDELLALIDQWGRFKPAGDCPTDCVIEKIASYGMAVGAEVFETVYWSGRFAQMFATGRGANRVHRIPRLDVKLQLCKDSRAKDANIRQALIDRIGPQGTKRAPGPTFGISGDCWAALGVAVTWYDKRNYRAAIEPRGEFVEARKR